MSHNCASLLQLICEAEFIEELLVELSLQPVVVVVLLADADAVAAAAPQGN